MEHNKSSIGEIFSAIVTGSVFGRLHLDRFRAIFLVRLELLPKKKEILHTSISLVSADYRLQQLNCKGTMEAFASVTDLIKCFIETISQQK